MRHKNPKIAATPHGMADGVKPTKQEPVKGTHTNVPEDIQKFVDSVPGKELRNTLLQHALMLSTTVSERDGIRRYADGLKQQNTDLQNAYQTLVSNQRLFVATAAMQGMISNPTITKNVPVNVNAAMEYTDALFAKLFPEPAKPESDGSPKTD
jgi:hypothetical protein